MSMPIVTSRYCDPPPRGEKDNSYRLLVCLYRPRGVKREDETWDAWWKELGPSKELHAAWYKKDGGPGLRWEEYRARYLDEMKSRGWWIRGLADRVRRGESIVLMCSSACVDPERCHTRLLKKLIEDEAFPAPAKAVGEARAGAVIKRQQRVGGS